MVAGAQRKLPSCPCRVEAPGWGAAQAQPPPAMGRVMEPATDMRTVLRSWKEKVFPEQVVLPYPDLKTRFWYIVLSIRLGQKH